MRSNSGLKTNDISFGLCPVKYDSISIQVRPWETLYDCYGTSFSSVVMLWNDPCLWFWHIDTWFNYCFYVFFITSTGIVEAYAGLYNYFSISSRLIGAKYVKDSYVPLIFIILVIYFPYFKYHFTFYIFVLT